MHQAIEYARSGAASANKAAEMYGIPKSTLKDRLSGRVQPGRRPGPHPYLMPSEEAELASHLIEAAAIGVGKTRSEVMRIAQEVAGAKGVLKRTQISSGWWRRFLERNPVLRLHAGDATAGMRIDAINEENMRAYFGLLKEVYNELDFEAHPERIYNMEQGAKESTISLFRSKGPNYGCLLLQCYRSGYSSIHNICSKATECIVDEKRSSWK